MTQCSVTFAQGHRCVRPVEALGYCHTCFEWRRRHDGADPNGRRGNMKHATPERHNSAQVRGVLPSACSVLFASGAPCSGRAHTHKFGGACKACNEWSLRNGDADPNGRTPAATRVSRAADFCTAVEALGGRVVGSYAGTRPPVHVVCRNGHDCHPKPVDVLRGSGFCARCFGKTHDVFYVVAGSGMVKPGITSGDPNGRLRDHAGRYGLTEQLLVREGLPDGDARWAEAEVLAQLKGLGAVPVHGREFFGEEWTDTVLQLAGWYL